MQSEQRRASCVFVVDDEEDVRDAIALLVKSHDLETRTFPSVDFFLAQFDPEQPGCLVLDVRMPGRSGLELQEWLARHAIPLPIIFVSGHGDIPMAVRAVHRGAVDFLQKPFSDGQLLERIDTALELDARRREEAAVTADVRRRLDALTPREREVLTLLMDGKPNKLIARALDVSPRTVEIHRARVLQKMGMDNASQLVRVMLEAGLEVDLREHRQ
ncbi:MAG: response regulator [Aquisalimonadaceae bacterium]